MKKKELQDIYFRFFNSEIANPKGTANEKTSQKKFEKNREVLIHDIQKNGTFIGNLRRTYKY